jgi:3-dehydroquinate synthase
MAEAIKHGVIADAEYFRRVADDAARLVADPGAPEMLALVARSIEIKAGVVRRDEREGGVRKTLNFGHTLGHAIESVSGYRMLHGEAVAVGMVLESVIAEEAGIAERGTAGCVREAVARAGLPIRRPRELEPERILAATRADKKARGGSTEYALPRRIGAMAGADSAWGVRVDDALVRGVLAADDGA